MFEHSVIEAERLAIVNAKREVGKIGERIESRVIRTLRTWNVSSMRKLFVKCNCL